MITLMNLTLTRFQVVDGHLAIVLVSSLGRQPPMSEFANEHFYLIQRHRRIEITSLNILAGEVRVKTPDAALSYLRLKTSHSTGFLVQRNPTSVITDILDRSQLDESVVYGDTAALNRLRLMRNGAYGILDRDLYNRLKIPRPTVVTQGERFLVSRPVLIGTIDTKYNISYRVCLLSQYVNNIGVVSKEIYHDLPQHIATAVQWSTHIYE